jgi:hypothetical protein
MIHSESDKGFKMNLQHVTLRKIVAEIRLEKLEYFFLNEVERELQNWRFYYRRIKKTTCREKMSR